MFGKKILLDNKEINRPELAKVIFNNDELREQLNKITYRYFKSRVKQVIENSGEEIIIIDAPLLIEAGLNKLCDIVVSIIANEDIKLKRICFRDNINEDIAKSRLNSQPKNDFYKKNSNYIIVNNDEDLDEEVEKFLKVMKNKRGKE